MFDEMNNKKETESLTEFAEFDAAEDISAAEEELAEDISSQETVGQAERDDLTENEKADETAKEEIGEGTFFSSSRLFGKSEEEMTAEFKNYKATQLLKKISLMLTDPYMPLVDFDDMIAAAMNLGLKGVTVLPDRLERAIKTANGGLPVSVCVCFPYAVDDFRAKLVAVKRAVRYAVEAVEMPINLTDVTERNVYTFEREYKKIRRVVGRKNFVLIADISRMTPMDMSLLSRICKNAGIDTVKTSCALKGSRVDDLALNNLKAVLGDRVKIVACSATSDEKEVVRSFAVGAAEFSGTDSVNLSKSMKETITA